MRAMKKQYGKEKGEQVFYASKNKGTIKGVQGKKKHEMAKKMHKDKKDNNYLFENVDKTIKRIKESGFDSRYDA